MLPSSMGLGRPARCGRSCLLVPSMSKTTTSLRPLCSQGPESLLRPGVPVAADGVAVDPESTFAELTGVEEDVAGLADGEVAFVKGRAGVGGCAQVRRRGIFHG